MALGCYSDSATLFDILFVQVQRFRWVVAPESMLFPSWCSPLEVSIPFCRGTQTKPPEGFQKACFWFCVFWNEIDTHSKVFSCFCFALLFLLTEWPGGSGLQHLLIMFYWNSGVPKHVWLCWKKSSDLQYVQGGMFRPVWPRDGFQSLSQRHI